MKLLIQELAGMNMSVNIKVEDITIKLGELFKLQKLNSLVHPIVKEEFNNWYKKQTSPYVIKEAAILFESNSHIGLDAVICVSAPLGLRMKRLLNRDNYSEKEIKKRIENQISQEEKEKRSDYIIVNNEKDLLLPQIIKIHKVLLS